MLTAEKMFVSTAGHCLGAMEDDINLAHSEGLNADRIDALSGNLQSLLKGAAAAKARAITMAGEYYQDTLDAARENPKAISHIVQRQFELRRLLNRFTGGVEDMSEIESAAPASSEPVTLPQDAEPVSDLDTARSNLVPLIRYAETEEQKSSLHMLARYSARAPHAKTTAGQPVRADHIFASLSAMGLGYARKRAKKVSLSYSSDEVVMSAVQARVCRQVLTHILEMRVSESLETPDMRRLAGKSVTGQVFLNARQTSGGHAVISYSDDGDNAVGVWSEKRISALNAQLAKTGMSIETSAADEFVLELTLAQAIVDQPVRARGVA